MIIVGQKIKDIIKVKKEERKSIQNKKLNRREAIQKGYQEIVKDLLLERIRFI